MERRARIWCKIPEWPFQGKGDQGKDPVTKDVSLESIMLGIDALNLSVRNVQADVGKKFSDLEGYLFEFRQELSGIKADMVSQAKFEQFEANFDRLEVRVNKLEQGSSQNPEIKQLRQQMARMDPANKSIRIRGFKVESLPERLACLQKELQHIGCNHINVEHIYKGPQGQRILTDMCVVDVGSNLIREKVLKDFGSKQITDQHRGE